MIGDQVVARLVQSCRRSKGDVGKRGDGFGYDGAISEDDRDEMGDSIPPAFLDVPSGKSERQVR